MAYKQRSPLPIANGGTNATSMTNTDGVVYYSGTALATTAVGTAGQVLTSNGVGMAPTFQPSSGGVPTTNPAFQVYLNGDPTNVTGDGTTYKIAFDTAVFNVSSSFNTGTNQFVAPVNGLYQFNATVSVDNLGAAHTILVADLNIAGILYHFAYLNPFAVVAANGIVSLSGSLLVSMAVNDIAYVTVGVFNGTKTVQLNGDLGNSSFSGYLVQAS